jgi:hypothetical protein
MRLNLTHDDALALQLALATANLEVVRNDLAPGLYDGIVTAVARINAQLTESITAYGLNPPCDGYCECHFSVEVNRGRTGHCVSCRPSTTRPGRAS